LVVIKEEFLVSRFLKLLKSPDLNLYDKNQMFLLLRSIILELMEHPNLFVLTIIKTHLICLQDMFSISTNIPNFFDINRNISVLMESK